MDVRVRILVVVAAWILVNLPLIHAHRLRLPLPTLLRIYPGQFFFLVLPFPIAVWFVVSAYGQAHGAFAQLDEPIELHWLLQNVLIMAVIIGVVVAALDLGAIGPELFARKQAEKNITYLDGLARKEFGQQADVDDANIAWTTPWDKAMVALEFVELVCVVVTAYTLFASAGLLASLNAAGVASQTVADAGTDLVFALLLFSTWVPLRIATIRILQIAGLNKPLLFTSPAVVLVTILFASLLVIFSFLGKAAGPILLAVLQLIFVVVPVVLAAAGTKYIYALFSDRNGIAALTMSVLVVVIGLIILTPFLTP